MDSQLHPQSYPTHGVEVRSAEEDDCALIASEMRSADQREVRALGLEPEEALLHSFHWTQDPMTVTLHGRPALMFGVSRYSLGGAVYGGVWLLGTDRIKEFSRLFLRESKRWLRDSSKGCDVLGNIVDARNTVHLRWLRWLGFRRVGETFIRSQRFIEFAKQGDDPCASL